MCVMDPWTVCPLGADRVRVRCGLGAGWVRVGCGLGANWVRVEF